MHMTTHIYTYIHINTHPQLYSHTPDILQKCCAASAAHVPPIDSASMRVARSYQIRVSPESYFPSRPLHLSLHPPLLRTSQPLFATRSGRCRAERYATHVIIDIHINKSLLSGSFQHIYVSFDVCGATIGAELRYATHVNREICIHKSFSRSVFHIYTSLFVFVTRLSVQSRGTPHMSTETYIYTRLFPRSLFHIYTSLLTFVAQLSVQK